MTLATRAIERKITEQVEFYECDGPSCDATEPAPFHSPAKSWYRVAQWGDPATLTRTLDVCSLACLREAVAQWEELAERGSASV